MKLKVKVWPEGEISVVCSVEPEAPPSPHTPDDVRK